jgi:hypothetical protein
VCRALGACIGLVSDARFVLLASNSRSDTGFASDFGACIHICGRVWRRFDGLEMEVSFGHLRQHSSF